MAIKNGNVSNADEVLNNLLGKQFKNWAQNLFNAKYIGFNSKLNGSGAPGLNDVKYDVFDSFTNTDFSFGFKEDSTNYKLTAVDVGGTTVNTLFYVILEGTLAAGISESDFEINGCHMQQISSGKWVFFCNNDQTATASGKGDRTVGYEKNRAAVYKTLFYGSDGTDARAATTTGLFTTAYWTTITAIKTIESRDVGKKGIYAYARDTTDNAGATYDGSFTSAATNVSSWSYIFLNTYSGDTASMNWECPSGTINHTTSIGGGSGGTTSSDETIEDTSTHIANPTTCQIERNAMNETTEVYTRMFMVSDKSITWTNNGFLNTSERDFQDDESNPLMTDATLDNSISLNTAVFESTPTTSTSTITDAILVVNDSIDTDNTATYKLSADGGTNYETVTPNQIHRFTNTGTSLIVKAEIERTTDPDGIDEIYEYAVMYNVGAGSA